VTSTKKRIGLVGARGHVGGELVRLLAGHPGFEIAWITSSRESGTAVRARIPSAPEGLSFEAADPARLAERGDADVVVLGLPNGESTQWTEAFAERRAPTVLIDLSSDHRGAPGWTYGNPEFRRAEIAGARRIANPGCYATALQLAVRPLLALISGPVHAFGVSGYSGAGATPSPRNDVEVLRDNVMPYALVDHAHEHEVTRELGHDVFFAPHVAPFFRGLVVTASFALREPATTHELCARVRDAYEREAFVRVASEPPLPRDAVWTHDVHIGGIVASRDGRHGAVVCALDNLLAGAASQALRNANLATGQQEHAGLR